MTANEDLALSNCDKEPVHIPGRIQPFGAVLGYDLNDGTILHHSSNLCSLVFQNSQVKVGQSCEDFIDDREIVHGIRGAIGLPTIRNQRDRVGLFQINGVPTELSAYVSNDVAVVEFEPAPHQSGKAQSSVSMVRMMMASISLEQGLDPLLHASVTALRHLTGHDRVMVYRFMDNGDGQVVAESKGPGIDPFLGLRYPAWDIPTQVRQIMLRAPFRVIHDIHAEHSALISAANVDPLDMTLSHLRGVSPIHVEYLANMGVRSTMNVSIIVRGQLWGLFAFHHYRPRMLSVDQRSICELFGHLSSMKIQQEEEREKLEQRQRSHSILFAIGDSSTEPENTITTLGEAMTEIVKCDGLAYVTADQVISVGTTPTDNVIRDIRDLSAEDTTAIDSLLLTGKFTPETLDQTAGALILTLTEELTLIFFRDEVAHEIRWAGKKEKTITVGPNGPRLSPRGSFGEYKESIVGRCHSWSPSDIETATDMRRALMKSMFVHASQAKTDWERQKTYQDLLIAELNHRVRNTLALVRSIAKQTACRSESLETYVDSLEQRIAALSTAHDLVGGSGQQWAKIQDLIRGELRPFDTKNNRIHYGGPPLAVRADVAPILSLLFHEMTTNAVKYGALTDEGVSLDIRWFEVADGLSLTWTETMKNRIPSPENRGFGSALIERALAFECDGSSSVNFHDNQLEIEFWIPKKSVNRLPEQLAEAPPKVPRTRVPVTNSAMDFTHVKSALIVEDNMILAMEMEKVLKQLGVANVSSVSTKDQAQDAIQRELPSIAVLDINLGGESSLDVANELHKRQVPLIFASGYDSKFELPVELAAVPRLTKPVEKLGLSAAITEALDMNQDAASPE